MYILVNAFQTLLIGLFSVLRTVYWYTYTTYGTYKANWVNVYRLYDVENQSEVILTTICQVLLKATLRGTGLFLSSCVLILFICRRLTFKHYDLGSTLKPYGHIALFSFANYLFYL